MQLKQKFPLVIQESYFEIILIAFLAILYAPLIIHWYDGWLNKTISIEHEYFSHGLIGLPFAVYIAWTNRKQWRRLDNQFNSMGAIILAIGAWFYLTGVAQFVNLSFPIILIGICLWLKGLPGLKLQGIALLFVVLATPNYIPYLITPYTLPLQAFIAGTAGFVLMHLGLDVTVNGIYLAIGGRLVEVAPYCAGLKMLFTSIYVALMLLYWTDNLSDRTKTSLLLIGAVIISIVANIMRNTILSFLHGTGNEAGFDWFHQGLGGDLYNAGMLAVIIFLLKLIERIDNYSHLPTNDQ